MKMSYSVAMLLVIVGGFLFAILASLSKDVFLIGNILDDIAGALFIAGTLGILDKYLLQNQLVNLVTSKVGLKKSIDATGITEIHLGWRDLPYEKLFAETKNNIDVVHVYAQTWTNLHADDFVEILRSKQTNIRIILLDPEDDIIINAFARQYNRTPEELKNQIRSVLKKWRKIYERSEINNKSRLKIYLQTGIQTMALYRFDNTIISSALTISKKPQSPYQLPSIICEKNEQTSILFDIYLKEIEGIIKEAREINVDDI